MITMIYLGLAAFFGGFITGSYKSHEQLRKCYEYSQEGSNHDKYVLSLGKERTCER